jgi:acyl carrier protein
MNDVHAAVNAMLSHVLENCKVIAPNKLLVDDLGIDSLKMVELMMMIEDEFNILIPVNDTTRIRTVSDLYQEIQCLTAQNISVPEHLGSLAARNN